MDTLPLDIGKLIHDLFDFPTQVNLRLVSKHFAESYPITNLYDNLLMSSKLTDEILESYPFTRKLFISYQMSITNINHLKYLQVLSIYEPYLKKNFGICHMINLQKLNVNHCEGITNDDLKFLINLTELSIHGTKITMIKHLTNLQVLHAAGTMINNDELSALTNLVTLNVNSTTSIIDVNHLTKLRELFAGNTCGIDDHGISLLDGLRKLHVPNNKKISKISHMTNLTILNANFKISDNDISNLTNLTELNVIANKWITNVNHLANLRILFAGSECGIDDNGISKLTNLTELCYEYNPKITRIISK